MLTGAHVELRAVHRTRDGVIAEPSFRQASITMRAVVVQREQLTFHTTHDHAVGSHSLDSSHRTLGEVGELTRP